MTKILEKFKEKNRKYIEQPEENTVGDVIAGFASIGIIVWGLNWWSDHFLP